MHELLSMNRNFELTDYIWQDFFLGLEKNILSRQQLVVWINKSFGFFTHLAFFYILTSECVELQKLKLKSG